MLARAGQDRMRIALYSHDAQGLGHVRRNLAIAGALSDAGRRDVLLIAGARQAGRFAMPPGVELLTLPALGKSRDGVYRSRSLALPLETLIHLRSETMCAALDSFEPDVLIVDKHPLGIEGELRAGLDQLAAIGHTRLVLGLREVLDAPEVVRAEWRRDGAAEAIRRRYDAIWIYGDRRVYDPVVEYGFDAGLAAKVRFSGFLGRLGGDPGHVGSAAARIGAGADALALCLVGGGEDGFELATAFADARLPRGTTGVIVAGPFMPVTQRRRLEAKAGAREDLVVCDFLEDPAPLLARASSVVTMGGYNSVCELLHHGCRTLVVPRVQPRREQLIRAERLAALDLLDVLHPDDLSPDALGAWLTARRVTRPHPSEVVDLNGLARLPGLLAELPKPLFNAHAGARALAI